jgi:hypothetical protein
VTEQHKATLWAVCGLNGNPVNGLWDWETNAKASAHKNVQPDEPMAVAKVVGRKWDRDAPNVLRWVYWMERSDKGLRTYHIKAGSEDGLSLPSRARPWAVWWRNSGCVRSYPTRREAEQAVRMVQDEDHPPVLYELIGGEVLQTRPQRPTRGLRRMMR